MISVQPGQVTAELVSLFDPQAPAGWRCQAVLQGAEAGKILADDSLQPRWGAVWEPGDGMLFLGGRPDVAIVHRLVATLRQAGEVLVGFWDPHDPITSLLPPDPTWTGSAIDFFDRPSDGSGLETYLRELPSDHIVCEMDRALLERCLWYEDTVRRHGSADAFLAHGKGFCLLRGDEIVCEAYAGNIVAGTRELGVITKEPYRGRGYATITCAHLVRACEQAGERTCWNCATTNLPSVAVARKLGYRTEKEFQWWAWSCLAEE